MSLPLCKRWATCDRCYTCAGACLLRGKSATVQRDAAINPSVSFALPPSLLSLNFHLCLCRSLSAVHHSFQSNHHLTLFLLKTEHYFNDYFLNRETCYYRPQSLTVCEPLQFGPSARSWIIA